jgi:hypothetical protein
MFMAEAVSLSRILIKGGPRTPRRKCHIYLTHCFTPKEEARKPVDSDDYRVPHAQSIGAVRSVGCVSIEADLLNIL